MQFLKRFTSSTPDIAALREANDIDGLIKALRYDDYDIQWRAAEALRTLGKDAFDRLLASLHHHDRDIRLGIIEALGEIRDPRAVPSLLPLLKDESMEVRWATALALGEMGNPHVIPSLFLSLLDPDKYVRYGAAIALEKLGWQPKTATETTHFLVGRGEWNAIATIGPEAVDPLLPLLKDQDPDVRIRVIELLGTLGGDTSKKFCRVALSDADTSVRWKAVTSGLQCGVSFMQIPIGISKRPRGEKNPIIAGFLNFILPGIGYQYSGRWWGFSVWQTYLLSLLTILLFINRDFPILPAIFIVFFAVYGWLSIPTWMTGANILIYSIHAMFAIHVWYKVRTVPDVL